MNKRPPIFYLNIRIMIQRIQSIYLILAFVCMCFALSTPLAEFTNQTVNCKMTAVRYEIFGTTALNPPATLPWGVLALTFVIIGLTAYIFFQFKSRMKQILLCNVSIAVHLFYFITYATYSIAFASHHQMSYSPGFYILLPVASLIFTMLARRGVKADEAKVRAADRIR